jgi:cell division protein FtsI (penicillin-binding protein 3)
MYLQFFRHGYYSNLCTKQYQARVIQRPQRGVILDCQGRVLAASNKIQTIFAEPRVIKDPQTVADKLAPILKINADEICRLITESKNPGFVKLIVGADPNQCKAAGKIYGIGILSDWQRYYPATSLVSHVVGFTSDDNRGLCGVELQHDKELHGLAGQEVFLADALRRPIKLKEKNSIVKDGTGIILTIDSAIQEFARSALLEQIQNFQAESGVVIVAEPRTGAILALVSLPDFDPANFHFANQNWLKNRAITDTFEPGSVFKPVVAAIAIDNQVIGLTDQIYCENGSYHGKGFGTIGEYSNHRYGNLTVRGILVKSSNIGMAKIGQKLGKARLFKGVKLFGFGKKTGIDLPGEGEGILRPLGQWNGYSETRVAYGQEISVTAIQLVQAFCVLANGGYPVRPFLVKATVDNTGKIVTLNQPAVQTQPIVSPTVARWIVSDALVGVVKEGTGTRAAVKKWQVFGKTGTANIAKSDQKGYSDSDYVASFIGGAPANDPEIVVLVSIRKPNKRLGKGYTGGAVASPVASKIIERTLTYMSKCRD